MQNSYQADNVDIVWVILRGLHNSQCINSLLPPGFIWGVQQFPTQDRWLHGDHNLS